MNRKMNFGWLPDIPDLRDYNEKSTSIKSMLKSVGIAKASKVSMPASVDLRRWCSEVEDQESIGSCTANAGVGLIEFFERKAFGKHLDASRLFLYKVTRNLLGWTGDTGAFLRDTMKAMVLFGVPPEDRWPYIIDDFEKEPTAFCYAFAQNFQAIEYYRLDPPGVSRHDLILRIKANLSAGLPSMFGFTVFSSISQAWNDGRIPFPAYGESRQGGHAVVAVGYDDDLEIENGNDGSVTTGAFLIRNSWGTDWGDEGYGWLPYKFVNQWMAVDWWSLLKNEWVDTGVFDS